MIDFAMITAPRNGNYLPRTITSFRMAGFSSEIAVFAEPKAKKFSMDGLSWNQNKETLGCFKNFTKALTYLLKSNKEYICVLSDDFKFSNNSLEVIEEKLKELKKSSKFGYLAMYTPTGCARHCPVYGLNLINQGWGVMWGGLYVFKRQAAKAILESNTYIDHYNNYKKNQQVDHLIPKVCSELGYNQWYLNPSLTTHIGNISTLGHVNSPREVGLNFV